MSVEDLQLTQDGMRQDDARGTLADEPVARNNIDGGAIEGIWMHRRRNYGKAREDDKSRTESTAGEIRGRFLVPAYRQLEVRVLTCRRTWNMATD